MDIYWYVKVSSLTNNLKSLVSWKTEIKKNSSILKGTKSGQGISFLPTSMTALRYTLGPLWSAAVKNKILPVLKELLRRGGMTDGQYSILVNELDKL